MLRSTPLRNVRQLKSVLTIGLALAGCADAAGDGSDSTSEASTVAASGAELEQLKVDLRGTMVLVTEEATLTPLSYPFDTSQQHVGVVVGNDEVMGCWAVLKASGKAQRALLKGTHYAVDAARVTLDAAPTRRARVPLVNADASGTATGSAADWEIVCQGNPPLRGDDLRANFEPFWGEPRVLQMWK